MSQLVKYGVDVDWSGLTAVAWLEPSAEDVPTAVVVPLKLCDGATFHFEKDDPRGLSYFRKPILGSQRVFLKDCCIHEFQGRSWLCRSEEGLLVGLAVLPSSEEVKEMFEDRPSSPFDEALLERKKLNEKKGDK